MLTALIVLVLVGLESSLGAEPRRCCFDKQYSVQLGIVGETLTDNPDTAFFIDGVVYLGFDYYTDRQATFTILTNQDGTNRTRYEVKDYATRRVYLRVNNGTCTYRDMEPYDTNRPHCIPDNATYMGPSTIGYGHNSMNLYTWSFSFQTDAAKPTQLILSVTQDHCVPVTESIIGVYEGVRLEESLFFIDYHPGVERLEYLEPPKNCQAAST